MEVNFILLFVLLCGTDNNQLHAPTEGENTYHFLGRFQTTSMGRNHGQPT